MRDYQEAYASFSLDDFAQEVLRAPLDAELNPYVLCCARWADGDVVALRWMGADGQTRDVTYRELDAASARFGQIEPAGSNIAARQQLLRPPCRCED